MVIIVNSKNGLSCYIFAVKLRGNLFFCNQRQVQKANLHARKSTASSAYKHYNLVAQAICLLAVNKLVAKCPSD